MSITRKFLDWEKPILHSAADFLMESFCQQEQLALDQVIVVVPGSQAGRRLREILLQQTQNQKLSYIPPEILTVGRLPEKLYEAKYPFATDFEQQLAWIQAIQNCDPSKREKVFSHLPEEGSFSEWLQYGSMLWQLHRELAADALDFKEVEAIGQKLPAFNEVERWQALAYLQQLYLKTLDDLELWDIQTARLYAIKHKECTTSKQIVLLATADMNQSLRRMLDQVAGQVTSLIAAPESWSDRFDLHGCLIPEVWQDLELDLNEDQIHLANDTSGQADTVLEVVASYNGKFSTDEITIGVADDRAVSQLQRRLQEYQLPTRWLIGRQLSETSPSLLLSSLQQYLVSRDTERWVQLVRHPDIFSWLESQGLTAGWLTEVDRYCQTHLPPQLGGSWLGPNSSHQQIRKAFQFIETLLQEVLTEMQQCLDVWAKSLMKIFATIYQDRLLDKELPSEAATITACNKIAACLRNQTLLPSELMPHLSAEQAVQLILDQLRQESIPAPPDPEAIEFSGWLELPLDDAPALIVTSCNESFLPASSLGDLFLPDLLRQELGLDHNLKRLARDKYAFKLILATREEVSFIAAKHDSEGNPHPISRLLLSGSLETVAQRIQTLSGDATTTKRTKLPGGLFDSTKGNSEFTIPIPQKLASPIESLRVTAFSDYLRCPYRFYLRHVLELKTVDAKAEELDALAFGSLIHDVLKMFGESELKDSTVENDINEFLQAALNDLARNLYGSSRKAAVNVQLRQLQVRLEAFAEWQASWARQGWQIRHIEVSGQNDQASLEVDGTPFGLRGRIDRIDSNQAGEWVIFDYKSSSNAMSPEKTHMEGSEWVDLQLPLYRHIARSLEIEGPMRFGYITLSRDSRQTGEKIATWTEDALEQADQVAGEVISKIRQEIFWPPSEDLKFIQEEFEAICMDQVFERPLMNMPSAE